ncbi:MAG: tRNA lysidine(34) synthetase TilS [Ilumatobacteraceae bacterium]
MAALLGRAHSLPLTAELLQRCSFTDPSIPLHCAVSGGADSVALAVLAVVHGNLVTLWHVDHGLRSGSSDEPHMVERLADQLGARFESRQLVLDDGPNLEARARDARYAVLPQDVLTGHTADDQAETMLINLLRGAGASGLAAMRPGSTRPLLSIRRAETHALCAALGIAPIVDPMNDDPRFLRVRVRQELLPLLNDIASRDIVPVLVRQADMLRADDDLLDALATEIEPTDAIALAKAPTALARRAVRKWLSTEHPPDLATVDRVLDVARGNTPGCDVGGNRQVRRTAQRLRIESITPQKREHGAL